MVNKKDKIKLFIRSQMPIKNQEKLKVGSKMLLILEKIFNHLQFLTQKICQKLTNLCK